MLAANDTGTQVVGINPNGLPLCAYDLAVDAHSNIYVIQCLDGHKDPAKYTMPRVFCFPPYRGQPDLTTNWSLGSADYSLENAVGIAVDPTGLWLAVAVRGYANGGTSLDLQNGGVNIYCATNGSPVTRLGAGTNHEYMDVAWDNAGNLYATDLNDRVWRAYSPPGANQATTTAAPIVQVYDALIRPWLSGPAAPASQFGFTLTGQSNVTYLIECSPDLINWTPVATNYDTFPSAPLRCRRRAPRAFSRRLRRKTDQAPIARA